MLAIPITVNLFLLVGCLAFSALIGFVFRSGQIISLKNKISQLEKEMLETHAELLDLHRSKVHLEEKLKVSSPIPVIPINVVAEEKSEKMPDVTMRKKLLSQKSAEKHS
jgi:uncharacterized protein YbcI